MQKSKNFKLLRRKWIAHHKKLREGIWTKHKSAMDWIVEKVPAKEQLASGAVGALMLTSTLPAAGVLANVSQSTSSPNIEVKVDKTSDLVSYFSQNVPHKAQPLSAAQEKNISDTLSSYYGFGVSAELDGKRLNRSYGLIGAEQHLARYPGDSVDQQLAGRDQWSMYGASGMAPGLGAWGYFAKSQDTISLTDIYCESHQVQPSLCIW